MRPSSQTVEGRAPIKTGGELRFDDMRHHETLNLWLILVNYVGWSWFKSSWQAWFITTSCRIWSWNMESFYVSLLSHREAQDVEAPLCAAYGCGQFVSWLQLEPMDHGPMVVQKPLASEVSNMLAYQWHGESQGEQWCYWLVMVNNRNTWKRWLILLTAIYLP